MRSRYRVFNETILPALWAKRDALCELYCQENGRPAIEPVIVTAVTLLQFMEKVPDRQAADNVRLHLGWKYALGLEVDHPGFHYSNLDGMGRNLQAQGEHHDEQPAELYVDAAYVTDDTMAEAQEQGREIIGPARPPGNPKNLLDVDQFDIDVANRTAVCPAGHTSRQCSLIHDQYNGSRCYRFEWAGLCDECHLQKQCTRRRDGRRQVSVGIHHDLLQQRRREMKTDEFKLKMHRRNAIEGTVSEFTRAGGRRSRYRGLAKTTLANYFQGAAVNINRWVRLAQWEVEKQRKAA